MRGRIGAGFGAVLAGALLFHCTDLTEIIVAVDTDLNPGTDFDRVEVRVLGEGHNETKPGEVKSAAALPATLGIAAGKNPSASVIVEATAFKGASSVARTTVTAQMVEGRSKLLHVSLCQSCPPEKQCGRSFGTSMPDYANALPPGHECAGIFADAGGFDAGVDAGTNDGGNVVDTGVPDGGTTNDCAVSCPPDTQCKLGACELLKNQACETTLTIDKTMKLRGRICPGQGATVDLGTCGGLTGPTSADVLQLGVGTYNLEVEQKGSARWVMRPVDSTCSGFLPNPGCASGGGAKQNGFVGPLKIAIGTAAASCAEYEIEVTKTQ